ncbi:DNA-binding PadR family transcriptional regulator [Sporomusaceae bacterium BoRhaA]|uniref:PadR family transcriptional regulator n=1 Tax=Pelorhabdus rhamnosifermentans TaxID=2772457 RepID=UPI001C060E91|nr:PadR family transcriptional regulator [Pelorhabdus rhamnosifermentans]MBU2702958.1 DNA-binding PadR family transcriptional regulator [Pelorhabdus rhamnosifermentans]
MSLPYAVLGILTYSPMTGYNLGKIFNKSVNYSWTASLSQIYRELGILEKKGYVLSDIQQQDDKPNKKIYHITNDGKRAFDEWLTDFPEFFSAPKRDEFTLRLFFGSKVGAVELIKQFKRFIEERQNFKQMMVEGKKTLTEMIKNAKKNETELSIQQDEIFWHFIVKRALMTNQMLIQWAKECITELEAMLSQEKQRSE